MTTWLPSTTGAVVFFLICQKVEATTCRSGDCTSECQNVPTILTSYIENVKTIHNQLLLVYIQLNRADESNNFLNNIQCEILYSGIRRGGIFSPWVCHYFQTLRAVTPSLKKIPLYGECSFQLIIGEKLSSSLRRCNNNWRPWNWNRRWSLPRKNELHDPTFSLSR